MASLLYIHSESNCTVVEGVFPLHLWEGLESLHLDACLWWKGETEASASCKLYKELEGIAYCACSVKLVYILLQYQPRSDCPQHRIDTEHLNY